MAKKSVKQYVSDMVKWYHGIKMSRDVVERNFQDAKFDFNTCMDRYFDVAANEDGKVEVDIEDVKNVKKVIVTKVTPSVVEWDCKKLKQLLNSKERKLVIQKHYQVTNWKGLFDFLKESGVDFKEFLKYVEVTESVRDKQLDKLVELGAVDEEEVKACSSVKLKGSYYKLTEK